MNKGKRSCPTFQEAPVQLMVNGQLVVTFMCTPYDLEDLALGHMLARGMIFNKEQILSLHADYHKRVIEVQAAEILEQVYTVSNVLLSGYSSVSAFSDQVYQLEPVAGNYALPRCILPEIAKSLEENAVLYKNGGGGVHGCLITCDNDASVHREDIGRHNAVDKAVGAGSQLGMDFSRCILASTGRISLDMVLKAVAVGAPVLASLSIPSDVAVDLGERLGICIVGRMGKDTPFVYTHPQRILTSQPVACRQRSCS